MTIQEVSSWQRGHTKSKHFPIFGIFLLFAVTARHLKKPKTTTTFKGFMGRFLVFFSFHSLTLSLSVCCVRINTIYTFYGYHFFLEQFFCAKKTFAFWVHSFGGNSNPRLPCLHGLGDLTEVVGIPEKVRILQEQPDVPYRFRSLRRPGVFLDLFGGWTFPAQFCGDYFINHKGIPMKNKQYDGK